MPVDRVESGLNVTASLLSVIGTAFILICYVILPHKTHIRHALIVNLTLADFINATNNSASGFYVLSSNNNLTDGDGCIANGFIGQLSVQAVDCSILAITFVTMWIITTSKNTAGISLKTIVLICAASWVLPVITSFTALFKKYYHPASTNWCWLQSDPAYLRYILTHGWRFLIIFLVTGMSIYTQVYLRRHLRSVAVFRQRPIPMQAHKSNAQCLQKNAIEKVSSEENHDNYESDKDDEERRIFHVATLDARRAAHSDQSTMSPPNSSKSPQPTLILPPVKHNIKNPLVPETPRDVKEPSRFNVKEVIKNPLSKKTATQKKQRSSVEKTMLLNAYPIFYILLWLPGIANRIADATGHKVYALQIMQASTQLIGFANAITFGWNERIGIQLRERFIEKRRRGSNPRSWEMSTNND